MSQICPRPHFHRGLIPLPVIAFICLQCYPYWRWLAVPADAFFFFFLWRRRRQEPLCSSATLRQPGVMEAPPGTATHLSSDHLLSLTEHIGLLIHSADVFLQLFSFSFFFPPKGQRWSLEESNTLAVALIWHNNRCNEKKIVKTLGYVPTLSCPWCWNGNFLPNDDLMFVRETEIPVARPPVTLKQFWWRV